MGHFANPYPLVPAKAGIQSSGLGASAAGRAFIPDAAWVPAFAGMSGVEGGTASPYATSCPRMTVRGDESDG